MFRKICRYVLPRRVRNHIDIFSFMRADGLLRKNDLSLFGDRVMVISPHPDDDIIGCGGTLHLLSKKGISLRSICMTDGRKGNVGRYSENDLVKTRYHEAKRAAEIIGIEDMVFFNERDGGLKPVKSVVLRLLDEIHKFRPSSILFPSVIDAHPDHTATTHIIFKAISSMKGELPLCIQYEVWTPIEFNIVMDIADVIKVKKQAILQFGSQLKHSNLVGSTLGLAKFRSVMTKNDDSYTDGFAEVFLATTSSEYLNLWKIIHG